MNIHIPILWLYSDASNWKINHTLIYIQTRFLLKIILNVSHKIPHGTHGHDTLVLF